MLNRLRLLVMLVAGLIAVSGLAACGDKTASESASGSEGDIAFAQAMIAHHQQAIEMADLALKHGRAAPVQQLAAEIKDAQDPEIEQMTNWLMAWDAPIEMSDNPDDMGDMPMSGMMSDGDMTALGNAAETRFDDLWLQMMIAHHEGAIEMAQAVLQTSTNDDVEALAEAIVEGQSAQVNQMERFSSR